MATPSPVISRYCKTCTSEYSKWLPPVAFSQLYSAPNSLSAGASPGSYSDPQTPGWFKRALLLREREGTGKEGRERKGEEWKREKGALTQIPGSAPGACEHSFASAGPRLWKNLPDDITDAQSSPEFRRTLILHLFRQYYTPNRILFYSLFLVCHHHGGPSSYFYLHHFKILCRCYYYSVLDKASKQLAYHLVSRLNIGAERPRENSGSITSTTDCPNTSYSSTWPHVNVSVV